MKLMIPPDDDFHPLKDTTSATLTTTTSTTSNSLKPEPISSSFNISITEEEVIVHSVIPDGIRIAEGPFGRCMIATKFFPAGTVLYRAYAGLVDTSKFDHKYTLLLYDKKENEDCCASSSLSLSSSSSTSSGSSTSTPPTDSTTSTTKDRAGMAMMMMMKSSSSLVVKEEFHLDALNSVKDYTTTDDDNGACGPQLDRRQVFGHDGFMNHSCDANVYHPLVYRTRDIMCYDTIALRDIPVGDEITSDYACYDYECDGHEIPVCGCNAINCRGEMKGFKYLPLQEKVRIMAWCEPEIVETFFRENPQIVLLQSTLPEGITIQGSNPAYQHDEHHQEEEICIKTLRKFEAGEKIFTNKAILIPNTEAERTAYILKIQSLNHQSSSYWLMDNTQHFIHRPDYVEALGFDSFMDHSCNPNSEQFYENDTTYHVFAKRTILPGEKITCDYLKLDNDASQVRNVGTTTFVCNCGADNCRNEIFS